MQNVINCHEKCEVPQRHIDRDTHDAWKSPGKFPKEMTDEEGGLHLLKVWSLDWRHEVTWEPLRNADSWASPQTD